MQSNGPYIICSGRFSAKVTSSKEPNPIPIDGLQASAREGRIKEKDTAKASETWDVNLGAPTIYKRNRSLWEFLLVQYS